MAIGFDIYPFLRVNLSFFVGKTTFWDFIHKHQQWKRVHTPINAGSPGVNQPHNNTGNHRRQDGMVRLPSAKTNHHRHPDGSADKLLLQRTFGMFDDVSKPQRNCQHTQINYLRWWHYLLLMNRISRKESVIIVKSPRPRPTNLVLIHCSHAQDAAG